MATQRLGKDKERQIWQTPSSSTTTSSLLNVSGNSLTKSVNGPVQSQSNRSKSAAMARRSVTPNSRAHDSKRSVTPVSSSGGDHEPSRVTTSKRSVTPLPRSNSIVAHDPGFLFSLTLFFFFEIVVLMLALVMLFEEFDY